MRHIWKGMTMAAAVVLSTGVAGAAGPPSGALTRCAPDAVVAGAGCMDKFEASVWRVPDPLGANRSLVRRIQQGRATVAFLEAAGATPLGIRGADDYAPCANSGQNCADDVYAVSVPGVIPSANITWFQALAACENARKRLPSSAEWQAAVAGTPDPGGDDGTTDCNTASAFHSIATGSRPACVSARGAFDMVGNLDEWVADWVPRSAACGFWGAGVSPTGDNQCLAGAETTGEPAALLRGGSFTNRELAGPLAILGTNPPTGSNFTVGFRCAR
jgi:formylglycine-generating enzyme required for sulfatase activity